MSELISSVDSIFGDGRPWAYRQCYLPGLKRGGYHQLLRANFSELVLLDVSAEEAWFDKYQSTIVLIATAKSDFMQSNNVSLADFFCLSTLK